jgi:hypothetical protein
MDEESKRIIKMEIWVSSVAILLAVFFYFNSSNRIMNSSCEHVKSAKGINCDYSHASKSIVPELD